MTTTDPTTTTPAWLKTDEIVPPELSERMRQLTEQGVNLLPLIKPWFDAAAAATKEFDAIITGQGIPDDLFPVVRELSGVEDLYDVAIWMEDLAARAAGDQGLARGEHRAALEAKFGEVGK